MSTGRSLRPTAARATRSGARGHDSDNYGGATPRTTTPDEPETGPKGREGAQADDEEEEETPIQEEKYLQQEPDYEGDGADKIGASPLAFSEELVEKILAEMDADSHAQQATEADDQMEAHPATADQSTRSDSSLSDSSTDSGDEHCATTMFPTWNFSPIQDEHVGSEMEVDNMPTGKVTTTTETIQQGSNLTSAIATPTLIYLQHARKLEARSSAQPQLAPAMLGAASCPHVGRKDAVVSFKDCLIEAKSVRRSAVTRSIIALYFKSISGGTQVVSHLGKVSVREQLANKLVAFVRDVGYSKTCFDFEVTAKGVAKIVPAKVLKAVTDVSGWPAPIADGTLKLLLADCLAVFADTRKHWHTFGEMCVTSPFVRSPTTPHLWHVWVPAAKLTADNVFGRFASRDQLPDLADTFDATSVAPGKVTKRKLGDMDPAGQEHFVGTSGGKRVRGGSAEFDPTAIVPVPAPVPKPFTRVRPTRKRGSSDQDHGSNKRAHTTTE
ncbi:hypothetical protein BCR44DRAFT_46888 [Catenaria anguillulae PL171]|uniref:Uncharacterized protein n=1 Tax=Catenaria anguillulae PL171 TaxID=765915 RepID=A0A1Y2H5J8_9FUNG|nr:hypothetical protein BCR44DRAFT_46888 [Catenaria anguillulae PL171]